MDANEQVHQPDGNPPPNLCFSDAAEQQAGGGPNEQAMATNHPEVSLAQPVKTVALVKTPPPKLANQFASLDAAQSRKMFADISEAIRNNAEAFVFACKDAAETWDALTPHLSRMQSLCPSGARSARRSSGKPDSPLGRSGSRVSRRTSD
jgi:hypothetical protein